MAVDQREAISFALGQKLDWVHPALEAHCVDLRSKRRLCVHVYFDAIIWAFPVDLHQPGLCA